MRVRLRARVNARLPDPDGKFRDEITQEIEVELDLKDIHAGEWEAHPSEVKELIKASEAEINAGLDKAFKKIKAMGGYDYTDAFKVPVTSTPPDEPTEEETKPQTEKEVIGTLNDVEILGDEILANCPANQDEELNCPIDNYGEGTLEEQAQALIWLSDKCGEVGESCPKYNHFIDSLPQPEEVN